MSFFMEILEATSSSSSSTNTVPNLTSMIPVLSMSYGVEKEIQHGTYESLATLPHAHNLIITKVACSKSGELMLHTSQKKPKLIRIYETESGGDGIAAAVSSLNIKMVYEFGDAHLFSFRGNSFSSSSGVVETIRADYTKLSIKNIDGASSSTHGYDLRKGKVIE